MTYDEAIKKWAAKKNNVNISDIEWVWIDDDSLNEGCPTCGHGSGIRVHIYFKDSNSGSRTIRISFENLLKEVLEVSQSK